MSETVPIHHALSDFLQRRGQFDSASTQVIIKSDLQYFNLRTRNVTPEADFALREATACTFPQVPNTFVQQQQARCLWLGPDEWLLTLPGGEDAEQKLRHSLDGICSLNQLDGGLLSISLVGDHARDILAKGCTLDLHPDKFLKGQCAQTGLSHASILLTLSEGEPGFNLIVRRSFAEYVALWLERAGAEYGISFAADDNQG